MSEQEDEGLALLAAGLIAQEKRGDPGAHNQLVEFVKFLRKEKIDYPYVLLRYLDEQECAFPHRDWHKKFKGKPPNRRNANRDRWIAERMHEIITRQDPSGTEWSKFLDSAAKEAIKAAPIHARARYQDMIEDGHTPMDAALAGVRLLGRRALRSLIDHMGGAQRSTPEDAFEAVLADWSKGKMWS